MYWVRLFGINNLYLRKTRMPNNIRYTFNYIIYEDHQRF